ncbi:unnamed protein product [Rhizophagus irregularis]|nr:unnamed protein product [Rhizophagus irregularis]CAB4415775.1 unnamed protein product [Rhizophagus irregularis]CAB4424273.1 unnamed protein product [Rhizophagus irregularis]
MINKIHKSQTSYLRICTFILAYSSSQIITRDYELERKSALFLDIYSLPFCLVGLLSFDLAQYAKKDE